MVNTDSDTLVKISFLGDNLKKWFLIGVGKIEEPITKKKLCYHRLRKSSVDGPIISELGGEAKVKTTLTEIFTPMAKQPNGEFGELLASGYANIFYVVRDVGLVLCVVFVSWHGGGWLVDAYLVDDPDA